MTERTRNLAVGLTVLIGLVLLAVLIVAFAGLPEAFQTGNKIHILFEQTYDIESGDSVYLRGKKIGVVTDVDFTDDDPRKGVTISARIDSDIRLPRNIQARVYTKGLVGKGYLTLQPEGPMPSDTAEEYYPPDEIITLRGIHSEDSGMLPPKLVQAFEDFGALAKNLNDLIAPEPPADQPTADTQPAGEAFPPGLKGSVARLNRTLDAMNAFFAKGETSLKGADELIRQLIIDAEDVSKVLHSLQQAADKINEGDGTAGKLLNDPKLYDNLVRVSEQMDGLVKDFRRLAKKWETQGMGVQLK
ncbi:MAG: MCE family protein [Phycisphaerae bacterium]|nr:MCE family protein [Phycisphaerae bacterium]